MSSRHGTIEHTNRHTPKWTPWKYEEGFMSLTSKCEVCRFVRRKMSVDVGGSHYHRSL